MDMSSLQADSEMDIKLNMPEGISVENGENTIKVNFKVTKDKSQLRI